MLTKAFNFNKLSWISLDVELGASFVPICIIMIALSKGEDCFLCQPTGSGKSIVFQALPFFVYAKTMSSGKEEVTLQIVLENCKSKALVVLSLLSLIRDQENTLIKKKIKVTSLMTTSVTSVEQLDEVGWNILIFVI